MLGQSGYLHAKAKEKGNQERPKAMKVELKQFHSLREAERYLNEFIKKKKVYSVSVSATENAHRDLLVAVLYK